LSVIMTR